MAAFDFQPFSKKQLQAMSWWMDSSPVREQEILIADGAVRSGKTVALINGFVDWSLDRFSDQNFILAGKSMGALTKNVLNPLKKMLITKDFPFHHVRSTEEPRLEIGSNDYYLYGANNISSKDTLTGLTAAGSFADQVALFPENFVSTMIDRCSIKDSRHWWNCNPQGPKHYIKTDYIDKAEEKRVFRQNFQLDDNLTLSQQIKDRYRRIHSGMWYKRNIKGRWVKAEGLIYDMYDSDRHIVSEGEVPEIKRRWVGIDYGTSHATAFVLIGLGVDGNLYILDEYKHSGKDMATSKTDSDYAEEFRDWLRDQKGEPIVPRWISIDPSAKSFRLQLWREREKHGALGKVRKADNDVLDGIRLVSSLFSSGRLKIVDSCEETKEELMLYSWDQKAQERGEDKPLKENDHLLDGLRYATMSINESLKNKLLTVGE